MQCIKPAWRTHWFRAKVLGHELLRADVLQLDLSPEKAWPQAIAGQHVLLTVEINGRLMTRPFSISSAPEQSHNQYPKKRVIRLTIKTNVDGAFTAKFLANIATGGYVNLSAPQGEFILSDSVLTEPSTPLWFVAAGSGITPFMAMLNQLALLPQPQNPIELVYFAKAGEHLYVDELMALQQQLSQLKVQLLIRKNDDNLVDALSDCTVQSQVLICGPSQFKHDVDQQLDAMKHPRQQRQAEYFQAPTFTQTAAGEQHVNLTQCGQTSQLVLAAKDTLLSGLEQQGISANFGCRIGVCHQCQCVKKSGVVRNLRTGELSQSGEQLIQLCISQAVTPLELEL
ncbi:flavin reductase family protein [Shewanella frigidimarina]|uniref:flavin reductase family protein n=1 Tax=Shewanella frigidimarina TaxID=56812 RepID=UPI003D790C7B